MRVSKTILKERVKRVNNRLHDDIELDYVECYGGYTLIKKDCSHLFPRMSAKEMYATLEGMLAMERLV